MVKRLNKKPFHFLALGPKLLPRTIPLIKPRKIFSDESLKSPEIPVTAAEIERVILIANVDKALGVNGFNAGFYRAC